MQWSTLRAIIESKAYWSLNFLFFAVPLLATFGVPLNGEIFSLYAAAWFLAVGGLVFAAARPDILRFPTFAEFSSSGQGQGQLRSWFERAGGVVDAVRDDGLRTRLTDPGQTDTVHPSVFWYVFSHVDRSRGAARLVIAACLLVAACLVVGVNVSRFIRVTKNVFGHQERSMVSVVRSPDLGFNMRVGGTADVEHEDGKAGVRTTSGELINSDDDGYVVLRLPDGAMVYIPKQRIVQISHRA